MLDKQFSSELYLLAHIISDTEMEVIITDMADDQVPALSPIKLQKKPVTTVVHLPRFQIQN